MKSMKPKCLPTRPFTDYLPVELVLSVFALASPSSTLPSSTGAVHAMLVSPENVLVRRSWRNRVLLGDGTFTICDWETELTNEQEEYFDAPQLVGSHPLFMLRAQLKGAQGRSTPAYAASQAPSVPPAHPLVSLDYVTYLYSPTGPFTPKLAIIAADDSAIGTELDRLWRHHFGWRPRWDDENDEQDEEQADDEPEVGEQNAGASGVAAQAGGPPDTQPQARAPAKVPLYSWWQPIPDAFHVVFYLIRSGQLDALEHALVRLVQHIPGLVTIAAGASRWCMLCLDDRSRTRDYFSILIEEEPDAEMTFSEFLITVTMFEWSLPTLETVLRALNLSANIVLSVANGSIFQSRFLSFIEGMTDADRVMELANWLERHDAPFALFPLSHKSRALSMFSRLLFEHDLPSAARASDPEAANAQVENAICGFILASGHGVKVMTIAMEKQLLSVNGWGYVLEQRTRFTHRGDTLLAALQETLCETAMWKDVVHQAIIHSMAYQNLNYFARARTLLINYLVDLDIDPVDYLFDHAATWTNEQLVKLFSTSPELPWSRPTALSHALDRFFHESPSTLTYKCRFFYEQLASNKVHIVCTLFRMCLKASGHQSIDPTPDLHSSVPEWLAQFSHQHMALLIMGFLHVFGPLDSANQLDLATPESALDVLRAAWVARLPPPGEVAPTLTSSLPVPFAHNLFDLAAAVTAKGIYEGFRSTPEMASRVKMMCKLLVDLDPDLVLIAMDCNWERGAEAVKDQFDLNDMAAASFSRSIAGMCMLTPVTVLSEALAVYELQKESRSRIKELLELRLKVEYAQAEVAVRVDILLNQLRKIE
ncbi:hypothetical protein BCR44DRAFT_1436576 [Catenaria anguillulae PL171]|uniref:Uncharacterized protein n=1 Tax=Catenaria anguillulae PL171 TaxID=765915 RepID=A0A1Y2HIM2_9FUNG|nr:hypothetical protein BCR44DRAFT_1436576 [Catenaria anguillulae PL171]